MAADPFSNLRIVTRDGVATVTIDNPPVNVLGYVLMNEVRRYLDSVRDDPETRVIVFESANPDFFIAHVDMTLAEQPEALNALQQDLAHGVNPFQALSERLRSQPQVTIVKLPGVDRRGKRTPVAG